MVTVIDKVTSSWRLQNERIELEQGLLFIITISLSEQSQYIYYYYENNVLWFIFYLQNAILWQLLPFCLGINIPSQLLNFCAALIEVKNLTGTI